MDIPSNYHILFVVGHLLLVIGQGFPCVMEMVLLMVGQSGIGDWSCCWWLFVMVVLVVGQCSADDWY